MVTAETQSGVTFAGTPKEQKLAELVFGLVLVRSQFLSSDAPIKVTVASLEAFLKEREKGATAAAIAKMAASNPEIFHIETTDGVEYLVTTRAGRTPVDRNIDQSHTFAERFMKPLPKPEKSSIPVRVRPTRNPSWVSIDSLLQGLAGQEFEEFEDEVEELVAEAAATEPGIAVEVVEVEPEVEAVPEPVVARTITVPSARMTDVSGVDDLELAGAISERLREDARVATFADQWMLEDRVPRFGKGDLRRLKDYIEEQEQPLTDDVLVQDVLGVRPGTPDFDLMRFAINFRLAHERDFDFVGTANQRFWSISSLPAIGTTRRKPNEIGTDYKFLQEDGAESGAPRSIDSTERVLTFYEFVHGLLPYDAEMQALLPAPVLPNQRSAVLTLECPQAYTTYLAELRYPTPNRGGFILGLDDFYAENLVPGAIIKIKATENDGHYIVEFATAGNTSGRLLEIDDRKQRYVFRPTTYSCAVMNEFLLDEDRFAGLANEKPLDEKTRRRPDSLIAATFERLGHRIEGTGYTADFADLLTAVNVERPFSEAYLRSILETDETGAFARDPDGSDAYTYVPGSPA